MSKTLGFIADSSARKREGCTGPRITNHKRHRRALTSHANSGRIHLNQRIAIGRIGGLYGIPAAPLGPIQGAIGLLYQHVSIDATPWREGGNADADGHNPIDPRFTGNLQRSNGFRNAMRQLNGVRCRGIREHHHELFTTVPRHQIQASARMLLQHQSHSLQALSLIHI